MSQAVRLLFFLLNFFTDLLRNGYNGFAKIFNRKVGILLLLDINDYIQYCVQYSMQYTLLLLTVPRDSMYKEVKQISMLVKIWISY